MRKLVGRALFFVVTAHATQSALADMTFTNSSGAPWGQPWRPARVQTDANRPFQQITSARDLAQVEGFLGSIYRLTAPSAGNSQRAQTLIDLVYAGYRARFPTMMANKVRPQFFVAQSPARANDAVNLTQGAATTTTGVIVFSEQFLQSTAVPQNQKLFVVAHEMAHLYLNHRNGPTTYFNVGYQNRAMTRTERSTFRDWFFLTKVTGSIASLDAGTVPVFNSFFAGRMAAFEGFAMFMAGAECRQAFQLRGQIERRLSGGFSRLTLSYPNAVDAETIRLTQEFNSRIETCRTDPQLSDSPIFEGQNFVFGDQVMTAQQVLSRMLPGRTIDLARDSHIGLFIDALKASTDRVIALEREMNMPEIRYYSVEDQADEIAAQVVNAIPAARNGIRAVRAQSPTRAEVVAAASEVILNLGLDLASDREQCKAWINSGALPPYGNLSKIHHSDCFRFLSVNLFAREYSTYLDLR